MAEYQDESRDPYLYEGTDVLNNIPGIRDAGKLQAFETAASIARDMELAMSPLPGQFARFQTNRTFSPGRADPARSAHFKNLAAR